MKEVYVQLLVALFALIAVSAALNVVLPHNPVNVLGKFYQITSKATSASVNVRVYIVGGDNATYDSGTGRHYFDDDYVDDFVSYITGLNGSFTPVVVVHGDAFPSEWAVARAPNTSEIATALRYFELNVNHAPAGSYRLYFNVSSAQLGSVAPGNVRLLRFELSNESWGELATFVVNSDVDPRQFYAELGNFSMFAIGESATTTTTTTSTTTTTLAAGGGGGGGGSGGGGRARSEEKLGGSTSFSVNKEVIKLKLKQGETASEVLRIENNGTATLNLEVVLHMDTAFVSFEGAGKKYRENLKPGEKTVLELIAAPGIGDLGVFVGKIVIKAEGVEQTVPVVVEVTPKGRALFDVNVKLLEGSQGVSARQRVSARVTLFNLGVTGKIPVKANYQILDLEGNVIAEDTEELVVETQLQKVKEFRLPAYVKAGTYVFSVKLEYFDGKETKIATSTDLFKVVEGPTLELPLAFGFNFNTLLIGALLFIILFVVLFQFKILDLLRVHQEVGKGMKESKRFLIKGKEKTQNELADFVEEAKRRMR